MISFIRGTVLTRNNEAVIGVAGGGFGLTVQLSTRSVAELPPVGEDVRLWTHLVVREDCWSLYGFTTRAERSMFELLISVTGIGPKVALAMLSVAAPTEIAAHLQSADEKGLTRLPGIGRKSAARLIVELSQRIPAELLALQATAAASPDAGPGDSLLEEAKLVLSSMGLQPARAEQALLAARSRDGSLSDDLERWVREALRAL